MTDDAELAALKRPAYGRLPGIFEPQSHRLAAKAGALRVHPGTCQPASASHADPGGQPLDLLGAVEPRAGQALRRHWLALNLGVSLYAGFSISCEAPHTCLPHRTSCWEVMAALRQLAAVANGGGLDEHSLHQLPKSERCWRG
jgi:hypothetical protein